MKNAGRFAAVISAAAMITSAVSPLYCNAEENVKMKEIIIDGAAMNTRENMLYRGAGMVSGNNSSRLLLDYKAEAPEAYSRLLEYMFGDEGIGITHLKLEMGSDINSSSGTEPSVKRFADEEADVTRGAGYQLAADAKKINPDLTLDMLWWSEPKWISDAEDIYGARYSWYKETLDAAYETYGLEFDYVSAVQNERGADADWVKYLSEHLKSETDCPYDYSKIKIVGGEEVCTWNFADMMKGDEELMEAVDVVGSHYTSSSTAAAKWLAKEKGKELWFSEASSPMCYAQGAYRFDGTGSGISGINGTLDIANRIIGMYPNGRMNLYEYQPVISAYYDGVTYCQKQLISACDPWSGYYQLDSGFYMSLHFSQFIKKGWAFIDEACYSDGKPGGDGHAIVDAVYSYMTAADTETGDYSTVITNTTSEPIEYIIRVSNLEKASSAVSVWETRGPDSGSYDENYFKKVSDITPDEKDGAYSYKVTVKPCSIVTVSTVTPARTEYTNADPSERTVLSLPYADDFEYSDHPDDYLSSRGNAPRYTTDQGGAFEVESTENGNVLVQQITPDIKSNEWGWTPDPVTCLGDDRWYNYSVCAAVKFDSSDEPSKNYAGAGLRYTLACNGISGYWIQLFEDGSWKLNANKTAKAEGKIEGFDSTAAHILKISACGNNICAYIDGEKAGEYTADSEALIGAGRAALFSSYNRNSFDDLLIEPVEGADTYITRYDNTDLCFEYEGEWEHNTMSSFKNYKRTISKGSEGSAVTVRFDGTGFALTGETGADTVLSVRIDEREAVTAGVYKTGLREISCRFDGLEKGAHTAKITVVSGKYSVDGMEVTGGDIPLPTAEEEISSEVSAETVLSADESEAAAVSEQSDENGSKSSPVIPIIAAAAGAALIGGAVVLKKKKSK
ncbi:MAG: glycosyl hydrolase family 59 [Huintestinicola sp.]